MSGNAHQLIVMFTRFDQAGTQGESRVYSRQLESDALIVVAMSESVLPSVRWRAAFSIRFAWEPTQRERA